GGEISSTSRRSRERHRRSAEIAATPRAARLQLRYIIDANWNLLLPRTVAWRSMAARFRSHGRHGDADRAHGRIRLVHNGAQARADSTGLAQRLRGNGGQAQDARDPVHADSIATELA